MTDRTSGTRIECSTAPRPSHRRASYRGGPFGAASAVIVALLAGCGGGGDGGPPTDSASPAPAPAPASSNAAQGGGSPTAGATPTQSAPFPPAVRAARTVTIPLPAGQEPIDPVEGLADGSSLNVGSPIRGTRSLLIDDAATTLVFGLRSSSAAAPRPYSLFRLDLSATSPVPQLVYDAVQRQADVAMCPTQGIRYSLSQDGAELVLPENTALTGGGCSSGTNVRGRLMAFGLSSGAIISAPLLQLDGQRVAEVNWTATWSHEEAALLSVAPTGSVRRIQYLTRPGRQASLLRVWPPVTMPPTLSTFDVSTQWMVGLLQLVPGGSLSSVGFLSSEPTQQPGWYRASFSLSGTGSVVREADAWTPGVVGLIDSVYANRGMSRTGTAVGADGRTGTPLPSFGVFSPPAYSPQGDIAAALCKGYPVASLYPVVTGQATPAPGVDPAEAVNRLLCRPAQVSSIGVIAVRGDSRVFLGSGGWLYRYDLQSGELRTGRVPSSLVVHGLSSDGRWLVTRQLEGGSLVLELHDTQDWLPVPRS